MKIGDRFETLVPLSFYIIHGTHGDEYISKMGNRLIKGKNNSVIYYGLINNDKHAFLLDLNDDAYFYWLLLDKGTRISNKLKKV